MRKLILWGMLFSFLLTAHRPLTENKGVEARTYRKSEVKHLAVRRKANRSKKYRVKPIRHRSSPGLEVWRFDMRAWNFFATYTIGGETKRQVKRRTQATFVVNGPYFNVRDQKPKQVIDLFWWKGNYYRLRRNDLGRPILVFSETGLRIDRPGRKKWKRRPGDVGAMAIDDYEQPRRRMARQLIGIKGKHVVVVRIPRATYREAAYYLRHVLRLSNFASFDGGHTYRQSTTAPAHFCAAPKGKRFVGELSAHRQRLARR